MSALRTFDQQFEPMTRAGAADKPAASSLESVLRRIAPAIRPNARRLVRANPRAGDLALVFPGALHAMCDPETPAEVRAAARRLVAEGAPLKLVAETLGLPLWMRRLPPDAFHGGVPDIAGSEIFTRRIANRLPSSRRISEFWLQSIAFAVEAADEDFAIWLADKVTGLKVGDPEAMFRLLAAYAWFSRHDVGLGRDLVHVRWRPEMSIETAICAAKSWLNRLRLVCQLPKDAVTDAWCEPGKVGAYAVVPLLAAPDLLEEARQMNNCADQYTDKIARDRCRLFGIRRGTAHIATLEVAGHPREPSMLTITQLKARNNLPASSDVWQVAYRWLSAQPSLWRMPQIVPPTRSHSAPIWQQVFEGYRRDRKGAGWIPAVPTMSEIEILERDIADLANRACVISWLFR